MSLFVVIAVVLTLAALGILIYPLLRPRQDQPPAWPLVSVLLLLVGGGGAALYPTWSNWNWSQTESAADSPAAMVGRLARRLEKQPDDLAGWLLLGRSYGVIEQFSLSARAYERADKLANGRNAEALMGLGEALINGELGDFGGPAGRMFEKALEIEPESVKAMFYSAIAARERNELPLARTRFARLLDANPPEEVRKVIEEQLRAVDAMAVLVGKEAASPAAASGAAPAAAKAGTSAAVSIPLRVTLSAAVAGKAKAGAVLFVVARIPGQRGMPLVAKRLDAKFPQQVELLSSDTPMGGNGFTVGQDLEIEARVANDGGAISRSGDPFGVVRVKTGAKGPFSIEINQLKP